MEKIGPNWGVGFKVFNPDFTCNGFQYDLGATYKHDAPIKLCSRGFHFCKRINDCFNYYSFHPDNVVCVVLYNKNFTIHGYNKSVTSRIKILKRITWSNVLNMSNIGHSNTGNRNTGNSNTGDWNTGDWNTGHCNTGDWNTGDCNTGDCNTGDSNTGNRNTGNRNTGDWNTGDCNTGYLNTNSPQIRIFNKYTDRENINFPDFFFFDVVEYCKKEKKYRSKDWFACWRDSWDNTYDIDRKKVLSLPNWDNEIFKEISGIDVHKELGINTQ